MCLSKKHWQLFKNIINVIICKYIFHVNIIQKLHFPIYLLIKFYDFDNSSFSIVRGKPGPIQVIGSNGENAARLLFIEKSGDRLLRIKRIGNN
jgi:hypothetical protein